MEFGRPVEFYSPAQSTHSHTLTWSPTLVPCSLSTAHFPSKPPGLLVPVSHLVSNHVPYFITASKDNINSTESVIQHYLPSKQSWTYVAYWPGKQNEEKVWIEYLGKFETNMYNILEGESGVQVCLSE
jgi:hypothetical protein